jgi:hypothetical protein
LEKILATTCASVIFLAGTVIAADKKLTKSELPAPVQKAAYDQSKGATVLGYASEQENGQILYEAQLKVNGHTKDVSMDASGKVVEVEEEVALNSLPPEVQKGLIAAAGKGKIGKVESLTKSGKLVAYEAVAVTNGKRSEVQVGPLGSKLDHDE